MSWGRGGMVGVRKAIWEHERVQKMAAEILATECGTRHETGTRADLCPKCQTQHATPASRPEGVTER